jgi:competence protein ComEC
MRNQNKPTRPLPPLGEKLRAVPLLRALVPMAAGIVLGTLAAVPLYVWTTAAVICGATAGFSLARRTAFSTLYVALAILFFGAALARAHTPRQIVPQGERVWMELLVTDTPVRREGRRSASTFGTVTRWQPDGGANTTTSGPANTPADNRADNRTPSGEWRPAGERLLVSIDTVWSFGAGDRVVFRGYVNPVGDTTSSYSRLMRARGYTGRTYISQYSLPSVTESGAKTPGAWAKKLQSGATERLRRLGRTAGDGDAIAVAANGDAIAVAAAMTTGDRTGITPELRRAYSRTGAAHLLAVSGLHVGIVFLVINVLLYLLPLARGGHIVKNIVAVAAIWLYAALTGLSPSAMRAAFMFTGAQAALAASQNRSPVNIMCGTALVMLAVRPGLLFDISFQLSFIAVAAIMAWFGPLYRLVASRRRGLNALWATLLVGFTASLATMPLVSYTFGVFSPAGIVLNPLVITTAYLIVCFSLLWIAMPVPWLEGVFRWLVAGPAWLQNRTVSLVADVPGAAIEWTMPLWGVFAVYAAMIIFTAWLAGRQRENEPFILSR